MPLVILLSIASIIVVGAIALRLGSDRRPKDIAWARGAMIAGLIPLGLQALVLALFGFGEMASGDVSGAGHLLPLAISVALGFLAWSRPLEGGIALVLVGFATTTQFYDITARMIMAVPQLLSGGLFLAAGVGGQIASRRKAGRVL